MFSSDFIIEYPTRELRACLEMLCARLRADFFPLTGKKGRGQSHSSSVIASQRWLLYLSPQGET